MEAAFRQELVRRLDFEVESEGVSTVVQLSERGRSRAIEGAIDRVGISRETGYEIIERTADDARATWPRGWFDWWAKEEGDS